MTAPVLPGATLGVLGGGQLGRMFALAAHRMGFKVAVYSEDEDAPASLAVDRHCHAPYEDLDRVAEFAHSVEVVTFEFENVPTATASAAARHVPVRPAGELLHKAVEIAKKSDATASHVLCLESGIPMQQAIS